MKCRAPHDEIFFTTSMIQELMKGQSINYLVLSRLEIESSFDSVPPLLKHRCQSLYKG